MTSNLHETWKRVGAKRAVSLMELNLANEPADLEDSVWAQLDEAVKAEISKQGMRRIRGIEHKTEVVEFMGARSKQYIATTVADDPDARKLNQRVEKL